MGADVADKMSGPYSALHASLLVAPASPHIPESRFQVAREGLRIHQVRSKLHGPDRFWRLRVGDYRVV